MRAGVFRCICVPSQQIPLTRATIETVMLRTGDKAIIAGAACIIGYERFVRDDNDLISYRVSAYRKHWLGRLIADAVILTTALHLMESVREDLDPFHHAMKYLRRKVAEQG